MQRYKKQKISLRQKRKKQKKRKMLFVFFGIFALGIFFLSLPDIVKYSGELKKTALSKLYVKKIIVKNLPLEIQEEILSIISLKPQTSLMSVDAKQLENKISRKMPQLKNVGIDISRIFGKITISAVLRIPAAVLLTDSDMKLIDDTGHIYIDSRSRVLSEQCLNLTGLKKADCIKPNFEKLPPVYIKDKLNSEKLPLEIVKSIKDIKKLESGFPHKPLLFDYRCATNSLSIILKDGSVINWGGFKFTKEKIVRLNQGFKQMDLSHKGPYNVELEFFQDGRILFSILNESG